MKSETTCINKNLESKSGFKPKLKDYLSVYDLFLRSGGRSLTAVTAAALIAEAVLLYILMQKETLYYENLFVRGAAIPVEIGFLLLAVCLYNPLKAHKSNVDYTIRRLNITPLFTYFTETCYVFLALFVYWALSFLVIYGFGMYFTGHISAAENYKLGMLIAICRTPQLKLLLPVGNIALWIKNVVALLAISTSISRANYYLRRNQTNILPAILCLAIFGRSAHGSIIYDIYTNSFITIVLAILGAFSLGSVIIEEKYPAKEPAESSKGGLWKRNGADKYERNNAGQDKVE